jgi:23S rRNA (uridine2552-2'-O)-methyltransferase
VGELNGRIISLDLLPMEPIEGVHYIQGDFREEAVLAQLEEAMGGGKADVVVSDMAPNLPAHGATDGRGLRCSSRWPSILRSTT